MARVRKRSEFTGEALTLTDSDFEDAAKRLFCEPGAIRAVAEVESGGRTGFLKDKRPKILFESRWFHKLTNGIHSKKHPEISTESWVRNYKGGAGEYERLAEAMKLDRDAAVKATSWGMFQILGINHRVAGFNKFEDFLGAHRVSEGEHLKAFVNFVIHNHLDDELRDRRWEDFARSYNGPGYKQNRYDEKMAQAYARHSGGFLAPSTAEIQMALNRNGADLLVDGMTGPATHRAIREFQRQHGLVIDGIAGPKTLLALGLVGTHDPVALSATINA
jgi:N-acetylmuramidase/Putative peptidoglycan binding domain